MFRWIQRATTLVGLYTVYRWLRDTRPTSPAAFAKGEEAPDNFVQVRNAGPDAVATPHKDWDEVDQASDESFPASDPGAKY